MCDSWSTNWHSDKFFHEKQPAKPLTWLQTLVRRILPEDGVPSQCNRCAIHGRQTGTVTNVSPQYFGYRPTHHPISSWRRAMEPVQAAAPKAVSSNGKTTKKEQRVRQVQEITQSSRNYFPRPGHPYASVADGFHTNRHQKHIHTDLCVPELHISWRGPSQTFYKCLISKHRLCSSTTEKELNKCNCEVIHQGCVSNMTNSVTFSAQTKFYLSHMIIYIYIYLYIYIYFIHTIFVTSQDFYFSGCTLTLYNLQESFFRS
jgi:hypothetical protein